MSRKWVVPAVALMVCASLLVLYLLSTKAERSTRRENEISYDILLGGARVGELVLEFDITRSQPVLRASGGLTLPLLRTGFLMETKLDKKFLPRVWTYYDSEEGSRLSFSDGNVNYFKWKPEGEIAVDEPSALPPEDAWELERSFRSSSPDILTALYRITTSRPFVEKDVKFLWEDEEWEARLTLDMNENRQMGGEKLKARQYSLSLVPRNQEAREREEELSDYVDITSCVKMWLCDGEIVRMRIVAHLLTNITVEMVRREGERAGR